MAAAVGAEVTAASGSGGLGLQSPRAEAAAAAAGPQQQQQQQQQPDSCTGCSSSFSSSQHFLGPERVHQVQVGG